MRSSWHVGAGVVSGRMSSLSEEGSDSEETSSTRTSWEMKIFFVDGR